ncbi:hypothetical protein [Burkholderia sp. 572]|uniref:hypothetical protein n=1 Tax=Burkholderia sp. 572 TaxID=3156414 RepID=UPI00339A51C9
MKKRPTDEQIIRILRECRERRRCSEELAQAARHYCTPLGTRSEIVETGWF